LVRVLFNGNDLKRCDEFASVTAFKMKKDDHAHYMRLDSEVYEHVFIGKLGEVAFVRFMNNLGFECEVDFEVYDKYLMDDGDLKINGKVIEVKSCKSGGKVLVEKWETVRKKSRMGVVPHYYILVEVGWDRKLEECKGWANILGFVDRESFIHEENFVEDGYVGNCPIHKPSYCLQLEELDECWDGFIRLFRRGGDLYGY